MKDAGAQNGHEVEAIGCPVYGDKVRCSVTYTETDGVLSLVGFDCSMEGMCGIPAWDPCPLYVAFLERRSHG